MKYTMMMAGLLLIGMGPVASASETTPMLINFGVAGGWYEPTTAGQGFAVDISPATNQLVAYWFTYPEQGGGREWYVAQGDISGASAELVVYRTEGGRFDQAADVMLEAVGNAGLSFDDCRSARLDYELDTGLAGSVELQRLGPDSYCEALLPDAQLQAVSHQNAWVSLSGSWLFSGCVTLGENESHGDERFIFEDRRLTLEIDTYTSPDCSGEAGLQILDFDLQRVDKTTAWLEGQEVIANRFVLVDRASAQEVRQLWYVDDRADLTRISHGVLDSQPDEDGFPSELHALFATRENP